MIHSHHGATGNALDLYRRRSFGRGHILCKQGSEVQWPPSERPTKTIAPNEELGLSDREPPG